MDKFTITLPESFVKQVLKLALADYNDLQDPEGEIDLKDFMADEKIMKKFMKELLQDVQEIYLCDPDNLCELIYAVKE